MESGKLNERITIKSHDGQTSYDVWCNVRPVTTREQLRNSTVLANNLLTLQIRYLKNINNTYKVIYQGYEYDIVTLQPGRYKASELDPIVLKLHARGVV